MSTNKLPTTQSVILKPRLQKIILEVNNPDLSKKQSKTISDFIEIYRTVVPPLMDKCTQTAISLDTLNPFIELQLSNTDYSHLNSEYHKILITIPLDKPAQSKLRFVGRKTGWDILDLTENVEDKYITFNASNVKAWKNIVHNIRPHLAHKHRMTRLRYDNYDNKLPV